jgi:hypothetical protein
VSDGLSGEHDIASIARQGRAMCPSTRPSLRDILPHLGDVPIAGITADSRKVEPGWLFVAVPGTKADGMSFVPDAIRVVLPPLSARARPPPAWQCLTRACPTPVRRSHGLRPPSTRVSPRRSSP